MASTPTPAPKLASHARATTCRNCGAPVGGNFCANCGQDTALHPLSVWEFVHEIVSHYVAAEGKLWRTLVLLALRPGRLTLEYLAGRRQRYIVPLRLYLTASFLFFALAQLAGHVAQPAVRVRVDLKDRVSAAAPVVSATPASVHDAANGGGVLLIGPPDQQTLDAIAAERFEDCLKPGAQCSMMKRLLAPAIIRLKDDPAGITERFGERFRHSLSYAMFLLLPIFALLLAVTYRGRHMYYGEHLVFALHVHSFWFFLALLDFLLPEAAADWLLLAYIAYGFWALQKVYGGRWWATLLRGLTVSTLYALVMGLGAAALSMFLLATV